MGAGISVAKDAEDNKQKIRKTQTKAKNYIALKSPAKI